MVAHVDSFLQIHRPIFRFQPFFFLHTLFYRAGSLSAGPFFYWQFSKCAGWAASLHTGQSPHVQKSHCIKCGGGGGAGWWEGEDVAEERLGCIDVVGCGGWQMEEAACEGAHGCCRHVGRPP